MSSKKDVLYIYLGGDSLHSGFYASWVKTVQSAGLNIYLIVPFKFTSRGFHKVPDHLGANKIDQVWQNLDGKFIVVPFFFLYRGLGNIIFKTILLLTIFRLAIGYRKIVIHSKLMNEYAVFIKKWMGDKRTKIICEFEGDFKSEIEYKSIFKEKRSLNDIESEWINTGLRDEQKIIERSDAVLCVTKRLQDVIMQRHSWTTDVTDRFYILPTAASRMMFSYDHSSRKILRTTLGLDDKFLVIYSGNLNGVWQIPDRIVSTFATICTIKPNAYLLILTQASDDKYILPHLQRHKIENYRIIHSPHYEVPRYLCSVDVGLLLREPHLMNEVATPAKFAEYALCGLPIIMTRGIGNYSLQLEETGYVVMLNDLYNEEENRLLLERFLNVGMQSLDRQAFSIWASERFSAEALAARITQMYCKQAAD